MYQYVYVASSQYHSDSFTRFSSWCSLESDMLRGRTTIMVSFHNFKSQNFNLSVSNPKSTYVAYLSVLSQISNCQGLGRKNKHEILKTDRSNNDNDNTNTVNMNTDSSIM